MSARRPRPTPSHRLPRLLIRLAARVRERRTGSSFLRARGGAAAVEMALVATPFFLLLFGILELGLVFLMSSTLENATAAAARTIRTGELQSGAAPTAAAFKSAICNNFAFMQSDCASNLYVDVQTFSTFSSVTAPQPVKNGNFDPSVLQFSPGGPQSIVLVRAYYQWTMFTPLMSQAVQQLNGGKMLLTSTATFRNEPYGS